MCSAPKVSWLMLCYRTPSTSGQPLDANVGEAIEQFMQFAEGLKFQTVQGKEAGTTYREAGRL